MTRHAKNSHSSPFFTSHERSILSYGSKKQRLGAESFRKFDACSLCNSTARDPRACPEGHLFCHSCILESLVQQKKLIKTHQEALEKRSGEEEEERNRARLEARERVLKDFERTQSALGGGSASGSAKEVVASSSKAEGEEDRGLKRKFGFDLDAVSKLAEDAEDAAMVKIEKEQAEARKAKLPAFWLPSLTPAADGPAPIKEMKLETMCHADKHPHPLSLKKLITVHFTPLPTPSNFIAASPNASTPIPSICPSCSKELTNGSTAVLIKTCGHVVCKSCVDKIVKPGKQCVSCDGRAKEKDLVELKRDGTGFAAAGGAETKKVGTAFQC